jgi:hypothetical protein
LSVPCRSADGTSERSYDFQVARRRSCSSGVLILALLTASCDGDRTSADGSQASTTAEARIVLIGSAENLPSLRQLKPGESRPTPITPDHGDQVWAVYLAVARVEGPSGVNIDDTDWKRAIEKLRANGLNVGEGGDLACDSGALEAMTDLKVDTGTALYFSTEGDAERFAGSLDPGPVRVMEVRHGCAD